MCRSSVRAVGALCAGTAQSLFHVRPSPGCGLPLYQHWLLYLPEAPVHLLPSRGCGGGNSVLGGASSSEPPHLQREEPGTEGCHLETAIVDVFQ